MTERKYLPTFAELVDRLAIVLLKEINIPENKEAYRQERHNIMHDLEMIRPRTALGIHATLMIMLANATIWWNEAEARKGGSEQDKLLKFTHSINGVRSRAKNQLSLLNDERTDLKVDCLAADLPPEFGNWRIFD